MKNKILKCIWTLAAILLGIAIFLLGVFAGKKIEKSKASGSGMTMSWQEYYNQSPTYDVMALDVSSTDMKPLSREEDCVTGLEIPEQEMITSLFNEEENGYTEVYEKKEEQKGDFLFTYYLDRHVYIDAYPSEVVFVTYTGNESYDTITDISSGYEGYGQGFLVSDELNKTFEGTLCLISNANLSEQFDYNYSFGLKSSQDASLPETEVEFTISH